MSAVNFHTPVNSTSLFGILKEPSVTVTPSGAVQPVKLYVPLTPSLVPARESGAGSTVTLLPVFTSDLPAASGGSVLSEDGLILTNTHIIEECSSATVTLHDDRTFDAKLIGADSISDIALLKIEAKGLVPAQLGSTEDIKVGQKVAALGNPLGETFRMTLTDGIISGLSRAMNYKGHTMTLLQTNAALNEGNSGGPLFNMYGQVIGVTNMKMMTSSTDNAIEGIGFAIPTDTMVEIVQSLIENGEVTGRATIGITVGGIPKEANSEYKLPEGLYVVSVVENSDAAKQGVKAGDILTAVNGQAVTETQQVLDIKENMKVGDKLTLTIWREGETFDVEITLMEANDLY